MARRKARTPIVVGDRNPLVGDILTELRNEETPGGNRQARFAELGFRLSVILAGETLRRIKLPTMAVTVRTPLGKQVDRHVIDRTGIVVVSVKRAGDIIQEAFTWLQPNIGTGSVDLHREERPPFNPIEGQHNLPSLAGKLVIVVDPMLATAGSACKTVEIAKAHGARRIVFVGWVGCTKGVRRLQLEHPDVQIVIAAIDPQLNAKAYIVPGLGDAGDRLFGPRNGIAPVQDERVLPPHTVAAVGAGNG